MKQCKQHPEVNIRFDGIVDYGEMWYCSGNKHYIFFPNKKHRILKLLRLRK